MPNVSSLTVMITGYGKHGLGDEAIRLFDKLLSDSAGVDVIY